MLHQSIKSIARLLAFVPLALFASTDLYSTETKVYDEVDGTLIMEMEQTPSPLGKWVERTSLKPFTGECYLEFMDNNEGLGPPHSPLEYRFRINTPGTYWISIRSHKRLTSDEGTTARKDMCNDCYVRVEGDYSSGDAEIPLAWLKRDTKYWGAAADMDWKNWATSVVEEDEIKTARYQFKAGEIYTLVISGRAQRFNLDRIVITRVEDQRYNDSDPESPLTSYSSRTSAKADGDGSVSLSGELKQWHKVTLDLAGPFAAEIDDAPNPFTDLRFDVTFTHSSGKPSYRIPGYFSTDGNAANSSATQGNVWRAHLSPDKTGKWTYRIHFSKGPHVAMDGGGDPLAPYDGKTGEFTIGKTDKSGRDFRASGRLIYDGGHYLRHAGSSQIFIKAGPDSPETLLAYADIDGTFPYKPHIPLKTWEPHLADWNEGDPTWQDGKGKALIGALNYLVEKGLNNVSFLTYNAGGDGDNVWPFISRNDKLHYDSSKLDQWGIVFDHATANGLHLHFKLQENENDDNRDRGPRRIDRPVPVALDGGKTGPQRKLYFREIIARYGHHLALNWNFGEENTQTAEEQRDMARYVAEIDPYQHNRVIHTYPFEQDQIYNELIGDQSDYTGASVQNNWDVSHERTYHWVRASAESGKPWVVANDEQGPAQVGVPPDLGYRGYEGKNSEGKEVGFDQHDIRKATLWGTLMAGGAGVEYLFGYKVAENDLNLEDFRSRDQTWDYCRIAIEFFYRPDIPTEKMVNRDELVGNPERGNSAYCFAQPGEVYLVFLPEGGQAQIDLSEAKGSFSLHWFNPRSGGPLKKAQSVKGGSTRTLAAPDDHDWLAILRKR